jgi:hypothetical protein
VLIPREGRGKRASISQDVAPALDEFGLAVARMIWRKCTSDRRHGSCQCRISVTVMQVI